MIGNLVHSEIVSYKGTVLWNVYLCLLQTHLIGYTGKIADEQTWESLCILFSNWRKSDAIKLVLLFLKEFLLSWN